MNAKQSSSNQTLTAGEMIRARKALRIAEMSSEHKRSRKKKNPSAGNRNHPDWRDPRHGGRTRLHKAAESGDLARVKKLVAAGVRLDILDNGGQNAASVALHEEHEEIAFFISAEMIARKNARKPKKRPRKA